MKSFGSELSVQGAGSRDEGRRTAWKELAGDEALSPWRRGHAV